MKKYGALRRLKWLKNKEREKQIWLDGLGWLEEEDKREEERKKESG